LGISPGAKLLTSNLSNMNKDKALDLAWLTHGDGCSLMAAARRLDGDVSAGISPMELGFSFY
jgi:hypothetical protein